MAEAYLVAEEKEKALKVAQKSLKSFPNKYVKFDYYTFNLVDVFYENKETEQADKIVNIFLRDASEILKQKKISQEDLTLYSFISSRIIELSKRFEEAKKYYNKANTIYLELLTKSEKR